MNTTPATGPWPVKVTKGSAAVTVYRIRDGAEFRLTWYDATGVRRSTSFTAADDALRAAKERAGELARGDHTVTLTHTEKMVYHRATAALRECGVPLDVAALDYAGARKRLGAHTLTEAVDHYVRTKAALEPRTVREVVEEFLARKTTETNRGRPASHDYLFDIRNRLTRFAAAMPNVPIASVDSKAVELVLDGAKLTGRNRTNSVRVLRTLFKYAASRRYYPEDADALEGIVAPVGAGVGDIAVFAPQEMSLLLEASRPESVPYLAIAAFAGLRSAELERIDWADVHLEEGHIEVKAALAKTASRRLVPIQPNLSAWLQSHRKESGRVCPFDSMAKQINWLVRDANALAKRKGAPGLRWKRNGLRHSFISYRVAALKDVAAVALEAGNSPQMVFRNYRAVVTEAAGKAWFAIAPTAAANVVPMTATA